MQRNFCKISLIAISILLVSSMSTPAQADADPFPGIATGQEIPGTRVSGTPGQSQSAFEASSAATNHSCPSGSGKGLNVDLNFTSSQSDDVVSYYCTKTWSDPETGEAVERARERAAQEAVQTQAQARANELGIQVCLPWTYTWRNGITQASGSACAMPTNLSQATTNASQPSTWIHVAADGTAKNRIVCTYAVCGDPTSSYRTSTLASGENYVPESSYVAPTPTASANPTASPSANPTASPSASSSTTSTSGDTSRGSGNSASAGSATAKNSAPNNSTIQQPASGPKKTSVDSTATPQSKVETPVIEDDGVEEDPTGSLRVKKTSASQYSIYVSTNISSEDVQVVATKKGFKTIRWTATTNELGKITIKTSRVLAGYKLTLSFEEEVLDILKVA